MLWALAAASLAYRTQARQATGFPSATADADKEPPPHTQGAEFASHTHTQQDTDATAIGRRRREEPAVASQKKVAEG